MGLHGTSFYSNCSISTPLFETKRIGYKERRCIGQLFDKGLGVAHVATLLGRSFDTLSRIKSYYENSTKRSIDKRRQDKRSRTKGYINFREKVDLWRCFTVMVKQGRFKDFLTAMSQRVHGEAAILDALAAIKKQTENSSDGSVEDPA